MRLYLGLRSASDAAPKATSPTKETAQDLANREPIQRLHDIIGLELIPSRCHRFK